MLYLPSVKSNAPTDIDFEPLLDSDVTDQLRDSANPEFGAQTPVGVFGRYCPCLDSPQSLQRATLNF
jgi:hypothetical protein